MIRIFRIIVGIVLIAGAVWFWHKHQSCNQEPDAARKTEQELNAVPDYDYISEIRQLIKVAQRSASGTGGNYPGTRTTEIEIY